jgi:plastocyanin
MNTVIRWLLAILPLIVTDVGWAATQTVNITNFQFSPASLTVNIGDTVKWVNQDPSPHTTTSDQSPPLWDKTLAKGASYSRVFTKEGTYTYHCAFHPSMKATVTVRTPEQTRVQTGKQIIGTTLPIKLNLAGKNPDSVYLGSYIVNAQSGCADCHSCPTYAPGRNPYKGQSKQFNAAGYLAGGVDFLPVATSANLTPGNLDLTRAEFKSLLRTGHDPDVAGKILLVMPWPVFGAMSDRDLDAVYDYLSAIPAAATPATHCPAPGQ